MSPKAAPLLLAFSLLTGVTMSDPSAQVPLPDAKPVPRMQVLPLPHDQASMLRDGAELTRYHFGAGQKRPYLYPILGPSGRSLTRMGHPHATASHGHHNSVWVAHDSVNGESFWTDSAPGRIVPQWIAEYRDGGEGCRIAAVHHWVGKDGRVHLIERRGMTAVPLPDGEWMLILDLQFEAGKEPAVLGKTPFGMAAVRMAKTIGVLDGGGLIRNSAGNVNEQGPNGVFWKKARWVDYSGPIAPGVNEGITLMDHPSNPNHPSTFHVRGDGWMGASLTFDSPRTVRPGEMLRLRYGLYVHRGVPPSPALEKQWSAFAKTKIETLPNDRK
ncbi:MAG: PmoA family protein [Armatimonadetes bacterium]|nr:PmoA family protein [Armatimonadota bacterium]